MCKIKTHFHAILYLNIPYFMEQTTISKTRFRNVASHKSTHIDITKNSSVHKENKSRK